MPSFDALNNQYREKITISLASFARECASQITDLENLVFKNAVKVELDEEDSITLENINTAFDSLFRAKDLKTYNLVVDRILEYLRRYKVRTEVNEKFEQTSKVKYKEISEEILAFYKKEVNRIINAKEKFDYVFKKDENDEDEDNKEDEIISATNIEQFPLLAEKVESLLPTLKQAAEKYSLQEVQEVNFRANSYYGLKDCFFENKYKKSGKANISSIIEKLDDLIEKDYINDVFSDDEYLYHILLVLEASYFVCTFYNSLFDDENTNKSIFHMNTGSLSFYMERNAAYFIDSIAYHTEYDFIEAYPRVTNEINADLIAKLFNKIVAINK